MSFALTFLHGLVEVLGEQGCAAVEECCERSDESADETNGHDTFDTGRQDVLHHEGECCISVVHHETVDATLSQGCCNHTRNKEHEAGEDLEETSGDGATTSASHHSLVVLTRNLTEYTLYDVLVGAPVPETDNAGSEEDHVARILSVHRVTRIGVEHVIDAVAVVHGTSCIHHRGPTFSDAAAAQCSQTEEQHEEGTDNQDRCLDGGKCHHTFHTSEDGEDCGDSNQTDSAYPEIQTQQVLKEDTTRESGYRDLSQHVSHEGDDAQPGTSALGIAELQEVRHSNDLTHLVNQQLIERHEEPAEDEDHPALHFPVSHTDAVFCACTGQTYKVLRTDVGSKDSHTDYVPRLALTKEISA